MANGPIHELIRHVNFALTQLHAQVTLKQVEDLAVMIHRAMTFQARSYHNLDHVFNFLDSADPVLNLAAFYHDLVYYQVDQGVATDIERLIAPYVRLTAGEFSLVEHLPAEDRLARLTLAVFDFQPGQRLRPTTGLNEFLSALVMNCLLGGLVAEGDLLQATLCIEATIPFRGRNARGFTPFEALGQRAQAINIEFELGLTTSTLETAIRRAVIFSNKDIANFGGDDVGRFLSDSWNLLIESNVPLRSKDTYSIHEYRQALQKMEGFMGSLNPNLIFGVHQDTPTPVEYAHLLQKTIANIETARAYFQIKLLTIALLEALADISGGDAPLSLFMGEIPRGDQHPQRLEDFLPEPVEVNTLDTDSLIYRLLDVGRVSEASFDLKNSPLTLFLYKTLTLEQQAHYLALAKQMFAGQLSAADFLRGVDPALVAALAHACAQMVFTRQAVLEEWR